MLSWETVPMMSTAAPVSVGVLRDHRVIQGQRSAGDRDSTRSAFTGRTTVAPGSSRSKKDTRSALCSFATAGGAATRAEDDVFGDRCVDQGQRPTADENASPGGHAADISLATMPGRGQILPGTLTALATIPTMPPSA